MLSRRTFHALSVLGFTALSLALPYKASAAAPQCAAIFEVKKTPEQVVQEVIEARLKQTKTMAIPMRDEAGRMMFVEAVPPIRPDMPMFLLMPGMNRSGRLTDASSIALIKAGYGVAEMSFSVHPFSVGSIAKNISPYFRKRKPKLQDFANEADFVASVLRETLGTQNVVPVSLSFSGAVSPMMKDYPLIIETVPMTSEHAVNEEGSAFRAKLKAGEMFNPIFGPMVSKSMMEQAYRTKWTPQAKAMVAQFGLPESRTQDMVEGYTAMSQAAEDATWKNAKISASTRRVFILAMGESPALLLNQLQTVQQLMKEGKNVVVFMVGSSGHIIPVDQPIAYAKILETVTSTKGSTLSGINVITPASPQAEGRVETYAAGEASNKWLVNAINFLQVQLAPKKAAK